MSDKDVVIVAGLMLFSALIVGPVIRILIRDGGGEIGAILKRCLGAVSFLLGLAILSWVIFIQISPGPDPQPEDNPFSIRRIAYAIGFLLVGWKWLFLGPGLSIGRQDVDFDAPELRAAVEEARRTLPYFIGELSEPIGKAYIRFAFAGDSGRMEHIWGYVVGYEYTVFTVSFLKDPEASEGEDDTRRNVPKSEVEDWKIVLPDGTVKGAYSRIGAFQLLENKGKRLSKAMLKEKALLLDA